MLNTTTDIAHVKKPKDLLHLGAVDISAITERLSILSDRVWQQEDLVKPNDYGCFRGNTKHIVLMFPDDLNDVRESSTTAGWIIWSAVLLPIMQQIAAHYGYKQPRFSKAMFARLQAGKSILPHVDQAEGNYQCHKIHVPLFTNPDARIVIDGTTYHLESGHAYEVNNVVPHEAVNGGDEDRVHFIFEFFDAA